MTVKDAIDAIREGKFAILVDHEHRENEGDFVMAAQDITPEAVNFLLQEGKGLICVPLESQRADLLELPLMVQDNREPMRCAFTVTVDAKEDITTGSSAEDRARVIRLLSDTATTKKDLVRPGHVFPLRAKGGGLKERQGHTEASLELCRLAGKEPVAVICEILNKDGSMARRPELMRLAREHRMPLVSVDEIRNYLEETTRQKGL